MSIFAKSAVLLVMIVMISDRAWGFSSFDPFPQQPTNSLAVQADVMQFLMFSFNDEPIDEIVSTGQRPAGEQSFWEIMSTLDKLSWMLLVCGGGGSAAAAANSTPVSAFLRGALGAIGGFAACVAADHGMSEIDEVFSEVLWRRHRGGQRV